MPGPEGPSLNVSGSVTLSASNLEPMWSVGPLDRRRVPGQRLLVSWRPSADLGSDRIREVGFKTPALVQDYSEIVVLCGDEILATITDIAEVQ